MAARHSARQDVINDFNRRKESSSIGNSPEHKLRSIGISFSPLDQARYPPCVVPVDTLIPMAIADMILTRHHRNRKVTLRICTPPKRRMLGITAIAEDEHGTTIALSLFNVPISSAIHTPETILPKGTICIVKEPFLKSKKKEGNSSIRVDHVTDIVFLNAADSRIPDIWKQPETRSSEAIRKKGKKYCKDNKWFSALNLFSVALDAAQTDAERQLALANRVQANLKVERYEAALSDATQFFNLERPEAVLSDATQLFELERPGAVLCDAIQAVNSPAPVPVKTLFRFAMAHYGLQNFVQCREALVKLLSAFPNEKRAKPALIRVDARLHEQRTGGYSFASIYEQGTYKQDADKKDADQKNADIQNTDEQDADEQDADEQDADEQDADEQDADEKDANKRDADKKAKPSPGLVDVANFYGPFEVRASAGRGRGLFLTKAVSAGDLILCEKALAYNRRPMTDFSTSLASVFEVQVLGADVDQLDKAELSAQLHQKLLHNPETYRPILELFAGPDFERTKIPPDAEPVIDAFLVRSIIEFNTIEIPVSLPEDSTESGRPHLRPPSEGVWLRASYMNHACYANCERSFIGDVVVVRAAQDLPAGAELTVAYLDTTPLDEDDRNPDGKLRRWAFSCTCDLCHARQAAFARDDRYNSSSDPAARARGPSLLSVIYEAGKTADEIESGALIAACERIDAMYPAYAGARGAPCPETWELLIPRLRQLRYAASRGTLPLGPMAYVDVVAAGLRAMSFDVVYSRNGFFIRRWGMVAPGLPLFFQILHIEYFRLNHRACPAIREYARVAFRILVGEDETFAECFPDLNY